MNDDAVLQGAPTRTRTLDEIASEYERTEITCVLLYDWGSDTYTNVFSVCEMCPTEQKKSLAITSEDPSGRLFPQVVKRLDKHRSIFILRRFEDDGLAAVKYFRGESDYRVINDNPPVRVISSGTTTIDPPNEVPVVLSMDQSPGMAGILPHRSAGLRVCTHLDTADTTRQLFGDKEFLEVSSFISQTIAVDLRHYHEFVGATILCFTNPILRRLNERLSSDKKSVLLELYPRLGKKLDGLTIELTDKRPNGSGFTQFYRCEQTKQLLTIPYSPYRIRTRLFHPEGDVLWDSSGHFMTGFQLNMGIMGPTRRLNVTKPDGKIETHEIQTMHYDTMGIPPTGVASPEDKLISAQRQRELDSLEANRTFVYFPPEDASVDKAKSMVRELLGQAKNECFICDPYLSASDVLEFALFVGNSALEVRLISSVKFLIQKVDNDSEITHGDNLYDVLESIRTQDPTAKIQCRALKGRNKSPLHDRFIVVDEQVYILGSSLNEFGSRATTLFRVPNPQPLIRQARRWWFEDEQAVGLTEWIATRHQSQPTRHSSYAAFLKILHRIKSSLRRKGDDTGNA